MMDTEVIPSKNSIKKYLARHHDEVMSLRRQINEVEDYISSCQLNYPRPYSNEWHDYRAKCWWKSHLDAKLSGYRAKWGYVMAYLEKQTATARQ